MSEARHDDPRAVAVIAFFEKLQPNDIDRISLFYTEQAFFKDPFNEVRNLAGVQRVFAHMFDTLDEPRFEVIDVLVQGQQCFLSWDFHFRRQGQAIERCIHGSSHLRFATDDRIAYHRDYWDAAEELYEKLPLLGNLLRWIKRRIKA